MTIRFTLQTLVALKQVQVDTSTLFEYGDCLASQDSLGYVYISKGDGSKAVRLHTLLLPDATLVDHKDRDPSNNMLENLRPATKAQNTINSKLRKDNSSGYRGVSYHAATKTWLARISIERKGKSVRLELGRFLNPDTAALVYNVFARKYHGEFAFINKVTTQLAKAEL